MAHTWLGIEDINVSNNKTGFCHHIANNLVEYTKKQSINQENAKLGPSRLTKGKIYIGLGVQRKGSSLVREDLECIRRERNCLVQF